jgi:Phospholipase_D-nuclease N-terminal
MAAQAKKKWSDLSPAQQRVIIVGGVIEVAVTAVALRDIARRPASEVRGSKLTWVLSFVVQPFGPLAYFAFGRSTAEVGEG